MIEEWAPVLTTSGTRPLSKLIGQEVQVISWDGRRPTVGSVLVEGSTRRATLKVTFDDYSYVEVSPDQVFLLNGGSKPAEQLRPGDSLLAFYMRLSEKRLLYQDPGDWHRGAIAQIDKQRWRPLARLVAEHKLGRRLEQDEVVKSCSGNPFDVRPETIVVTKRRRSDKRFDPFSKALVEAKRFLDAWRPPNNHKVVDVEGGHCFAAGSMVYVVEGSMITPMTIERYAAEGLWRPILGFDMEKKLIRKVNVSNAWLTKKAAPVLKIGFSNNSMLRVTPEHKVLTVDGGYVEAHTLKVGDRVISAIAGFNLKSKSILTSHAPGTAWVTQPPRPDMRDSYRVFDVTTETSNLIVDGIVCHNSSECLSLRALSSDSFVINGVFLSVGN